MTDCKGSNWAGVNELRAKVKYLEKENNELKKEIENLKDDKTSHRSGQSFPGVGRYICKFRKFK